MPPVLRVLHWPEARSAAAPQPVGRLRITGRLADVCAELDRLAAANDAHAPWPCRA